MLIEFAAGTPVGLLTLARIENELSNLLGRKVHLNRAGRLRRSFRDEVLEKAEAQYVSVDALLPGPSPASESP